MTQADIEPESTQDATVPVRDPYKRALVVRFGGLGDILLATPSVRELEHRFPGIEIDFIVGKGFSPVLTGLPYIRRVIEFDKNGADAQPAAMVRFMRELHTARYDLFLNFHPSVKTALFGLATGARKQVYFIKNRRKSGLTGRVPHAIDDFAKELRKLGIGKIVSQQMDFVVGDEARARVADLLAGEGVVPGDRFLLVNPGATRIINRWPVDRLAAVCDEFARMPGCRVALTGGSGDRDLVDNVISRSTCASSIIDLCGRLSIKELGAVIERSNAFLTCDTGPMHIAAALDTPLVALFGPADPDRTGPLSSNSVVLIDRSLPCIACQNRTCKFGSDIRCMSGISVATVIAALRAKLDGKAYVPLEVATTVAS